jgi:hypothetical protein
VTPRIDTRTFRIAGPQTEALPMPVSLGSRIGIERAGEERFTFEVITRNPTNSSTDVERFSIRERSVPIAKMYKDVITPISQCCY